MKLFTPAIHNDILKHKHTYWGELSGQQEFERLWREIFNDLQHADGLRPEGIMPYNYQKIRDEHIRRDRQRLIDDTIFNSVKGSVVNQHTTTQQIGRSTYQPFNSPLDTCIMLLSSELDQI